MTHSEDLQGTYFVGGDGRVKGGEDLANNPMGDARAGRLAHESLLATLPDLLTLRNLTMAGGMNTWWHGSM